jgi:hypothetical protein
MQATVLIVILVCILVVVLVRQRRRRRRVIVAPRFATLNLNGAEGEALVQADTQALQPVLGIAEQSNFVPPRCDVLFVYSNISPDGRIESTRMSLGELIRASGATILVVASENIGAHYVACNKTGPYGPVNLVMTLSRRGDLFPRFFVRLFEDMKRGTSMPLAWVKLAPQGPMSESDELPSTIFACMAGQVAFGEGAASKVTDARC